LVIHKKIVRRSRRAAYFGARVSFMALVAAIPAHAWAQCSPDPSQSGTAVTCSGSDTNGYTISTSASPLTVNSDASVTNSGASAITVSIPSTGTFISRSASITVNGSVSATGAAGINVQSGTIISGSYDYYGTTASITVASGASVSGTYGITATQSTGNATGAAAVTLDNAGTISGTSGVALYATGYYYSSSGYFSSLINRAGGSIGAIQATINSINNAGTINGGSLSALAAGTYFYGTFVNSGTITSASGNPTILNYSNITNSGTISNTGGGLALDGTALNLTNLTGGTITANGSSVLGSGTSSITLVNSGAGAALSGTSLTVTNNVGGVIRAGTGNVALTASSGVSLVNQGAITGNIVAGTGGSSGFASTIDSTAGTVTGNLTLGNGNDTLVATLKNGGLYTGISGAINGGGGTNTVQLKTSADATLSAALSLPTNFSQIDFMPAFGTTLTLASTYPTTSSVLFDGAGTLDNQATISGTGQVVGQMNYSSSGTFRNSGTIISANSGSTASAINLTGYANFVNSGTVTATGNGVNVSGNSVNNTGSITAGGTAVSGFLGSSNSFANSGTIRSTGGIGASISLSCTCYSGTNSGTIAGATVGLSLGSGTIVNTGTISSAGTGVQLGSYATLDNRAGGVVTGNNGIAISGNNNFNVTVINAGTINGNVNLANTYGFAIGSGNYYVAAAGGVLNGNLTLGLGDTLVADISSAGTGKFAGITGTVSANQSNLIYTVNSDASATAVAPNGFSSLAYQLGNKATLSLTSSGTASAPLKLSGTGNVALSGSLTTRNQSAVQSVSGYGNSTNALAITNSGTISVTHDNASTYGFSALALGSADSLTNTGSIAMIDTVTTGSTSYAAVGGAGSIVNSGTISGTGVNGVSLGNYYSSSLASLTNSGAITSTKTAVLLNGGGAITNAGTLSSTGGAAISNSNTGYSYTVTNQAGGTISGLGTAVQLYGGTVSNAGTINGDVNLAYYPYGGGSAYATGAYIANGGTLNGNLIFGSNTDYLIETGSGYGVTGTIDGGAGTNWVGHQRSGTATVTLGGALPTNFTKEFTLVSGADSQVTVTGQSGYTGAIIVGGDGKIVNQLATTGGVLGLGAAGLYGAPAYNTELGGFSNRANVGSVSLVTGSFDNTAVIGSATLYGASVALSTSKAFNISNSGSIFNGAFLPAVTLYGTTTDNSTIANSGTIVGGLSLSLLAASGNMVSIGNSGAITGFTQSYYNYDPTVPAYVLTSSSIAISAYANGAKGLNLTNSGTIKGDIYLDGSDVTLVNTGTIIGNISTGVGNDSIALNGVYSGSIDGGTGTNTLSINGGSQAVPVAFGSVSNFATLTQTGGFATVSGVGVFGNVALTGGRLVGLAGSVLNAANFNVGSNATFGSAGIVNGNVVVSGILSPGASPGTMTVNGNVTLNSGSTSLFEITPTVSDKLIVNGKMTILPGSTLQIAATGPVKVGSTLDLINASGGVNGTYDTVTGLAGNVRKLANGDLGLLVQFANPDSYNPQLRRAVAYVNSAMAASSAPAALTPALSALQDGNGAPIASAFARLTPEPYADALQIGTETALSLAGNSRTIGEGEASGATHVFGFGQGLGNLRQFASREAEGVSHATINGFGALGGLGVAGQGYAVSAYVGWMDQSQSISALAASTKARGVVGGVAARFGGPTRITLSVNYDAAHALTRRYVPDAGTISTAYALPSWSFDASISHAVPLGQSWVVRPQIGTTWVTTSHDPISEASAHPFALKVDEAQITQGFVDAGLGFETAPDATGPWRRFLTLGARYRVEGDPMTATAALAGYTSSLTALGVGRNRVDATMAAGVEYRLAPGASLFLNASGELGKASKRESVTAGMRFRL
jgi:hypothetical protein